MADLNKQNPIGDYTQIGLDEKLNSETSLLRINEVKEDAPLNLLEQQQEEAPTIIYISPENIQAGVFGAFDTTSGIEFGIDKANKISYVQSRNFVSGSTGWRWDNNGNIEAESGTFRGTIRATTGTIGGWNIITSYLYGLVSGTPTSSPSDGVVLKSGSAGGITVYENTEKRVELGYLSAGVYGIKGFADDGSTVIFEISDDQKYFNGAYLGAGTVASGAVRISLRGASHDLVVEEEVLEVVEEVVLVDVEVELLVLVEELEVVDVEVLELVELELVEVEVLELVEVEEVVEVVVDVLVLVEVVDDVVELVEVEVDEVVVLVVVVAVVVVLVVEEVVELVVLVVVEVVLDVEVVVLLVVDVVELVVELVVDEVVELVEEEVVEDVVEDVVVEVVLVAVVVVLVVVEVVLVAVVVVEVVVVVVVISEGSFGVMVSIYQEKVPE